MKCELQYRRQNKRSQYSVKNVNQDPYIRRRYFGFHISTPYAPWYVVPLASPPPLLHCA